MSRTIAAAVLGIAAVVVGGAFAGWQPIQPVVDPGTAAFDRVLADAGLYRLPGQSIAPDYRPWAKCPAGEQSLGGVWALRDKDGGLGDYAVCVRPDGTAYVFVHAHFSPEDIAAGKERAKARDQEIMADRARREADAEAARNTFADQRRN